MPSPKKAWSLLKETFKSWSEDYAPSMGAALSYYTMFSIAPLLLIVISVAGLFFGVDAVRNEIFGQLSGLMGDQGAHAIQDMLANVNQPKKGALGTILGVVMLFLGASTVFGELQNALDRIWRAPAKDKKGGIFGLLRSRLLSFGMVMGLAFVIVVSLVMSAALAALGKWWAPMFGSWEVFAHALDLAVSFGLLTVVFALIYKVIPRVHVGWHDVWVGAAFTALLFTIGKFLIGLYLGKSNVASGFGAAGSLVLVMVWVYYSAQIFYLGAEFTWVYAHSSGSRRGQTRPQSQKETPNKVEQGTGRVAPAHPVAANSDLAHTPGKPAISPGARAAVEARRAEQFPLPTSATAAAPQVAVNRGRLIFNPREKGLEKAITRKVERLEAASSTRAPALIALGIAAAAGLVTGIVMHVQKRFPQRLGLGH
jgi:membrane protein